MLSCMCRHRRESRILLEGTLGLHGMRACPAKEPDQAASSTGAASSARAEGVEEAAEVERLQRLADGLNAMPTALRSVEQALRR